MRRLFIVGCPRSGTTLLQSLLAAHPQIASFPESHFFSRTIPSKVLPRKLGIASRSARTKLYQFLCEISHDEMRQYLPRFCFFTRQYARVFIKILDTLTLQQNKSLWIEKTPGHLHYIDDISKLVPEVKFIHLIRNGEDVVASLYEVSETWKGTSRYDIDQCIQRWIESIMITRFHLHKPNHVLVRYEQLVEEPRLILINLCKFIDVPFNDIILKEYRNTSEQLVLKNEIWKTSVKYEIKSANHKKFYSLFNEEQRKYIKNQISKIDLEELPPSFDIPHSHR